MRFTLMVALMLPALDSAAADAPLQTSTAVEELAAAFHVISSLQAIGYPSGQVHPEETVWQVYPAARARGNADAYWAPIFHDYVRSSAPVCSFATATSDAVLHQLLYREMSASPALAVIYKGRSLDECVAWRLRVQQSMFEVTLATIKNAEARRWLTEYQERSSAQLRKLGTAENPPSALPYARRIQEFADTWQKFQLANR